MSAQDDVEWLTRDVFHDYPAVALRIGTQIVEIDEVRVFQVQALCHAAQLDLCIAPHQLEGDFFAAVADSEINFAEAAATNAALQRETIQRPLSRTVGELHTQPPTWILPVRISARVVLFALVDTSGW